MSERARDAVRLAARRIVEGRAVRMGELADELGVTRVSLHRWVGSREQLLGEAMWLLAADSIAGARRTPTRSRGGARVADVVGRYIGAVNAAPGVRAFIEREPELALRLLTTRASPVQARSVTAVEELLGEEVAGGRLEPPMELRDLAYVIVRIAESFLFTNLITGEPPDAQKARQAVAALLR
ncbi:MAG TPA: QsdR family transcriptional regulator [Solirubrobacteraceae bacterium]